MRGFLYIFNLAFTLMEENHARKADVQLMGETIHLPFGAGKEGLGDRSPVAGGGSVLTASWQQCLEPAMLLPGWGTFDRRTCLYCFWPKAFVRMQD